MNKEKTRLLYMQAPVSNGVAIIISLLYYYLLQPRQDSNLLFLWMAMLLMTASYRLYLWYRRKSAPAARSAASWLNHYLVGCGLMGGSWSLIYPLVYGTNDPFVLAALLMLAFGVISSAIPILSADMPAFVLYTYPQGLMLSITLLRFEDATYYWLAFAVGVFMVMITLFTRNANRSILQSIRLQEQNANLIDDLNSEINQREALISRRTLELEEKNHDLIIEIKNRERTEEQLQQANANLAATLQAIPDLLFKLDEKGNYLDLWTRDSALLAAQKEILIGRNVSEMLPADAAHEVMEAIRVAAETGTSYGQVIRLLLDTDMHWFELSSSREQCSDGSNQFFMLSRDITYKHQIEIELEQHRAHLEELVLARTRELREAQAELLRKNRLATLGQLTATVSHELRNPLGAMRLSLYTIRKRVGGKEDPRLTQALERIDRNITRCNRIIDELLDFTRIKEIDLLPTAVDDWLGGLLDDLAVPEGITVTREPGLPGLETMLDPDRLRRAVINVYDNACQAMLEDTATGNGKAPTLTVATRERDGRIEIELTDMGPGIAPAVLERIFEPLYSTKGFGVGLGLPTVRQIMAQHGGGVEMDTAVGRGTRTLLWLPFATTDEVAGARAF